MPTPPDLTPLEQEPPEAPAPSYSDVLCQLLTDIAGSDKNRVAAESTIASLTADLMNKKHLGQQDLLTLTQLSAAHAASEHAKKEIAKNLHLVQTLTVEPLRQVLLKTPLALTLSEYAFTLSTAPNPINAWMLDLTISYQPA